MVRAQIPGNGRRLLPGSEAVKVGLPLAILWAFHAAAADVPGAGYVRLPILFGMSATILAWRLSSSRRRGWSAHKNGVTLGFCCWGIAATFSAIFNWHAAQVPMTYISVFLAGGAVYVALSGLRFTSTDLDAAIVGLAVGTLFSIGSGLVAFAQGSAISGNPGNMAGFLLIVTPILVATACESRKGIVLRTFCGATLVPIALGFFVLQQSAAFVTMSLVIPLVCMFKLGVRRLPLFAAAVILGAVLVLKFQPEPGSTVTARLLPAIDTVAGGAPRAWLIGGGPGAGSVQAMETGILGLVGIILLSIGVGVSLCRIVTRGRDDQVNDTRFMLVIGPAAYVVYSILTDSAPDNVGVTTWTVLVASMLALMPPFGPRVRLDRSHAEDAVQHEHPSSPQFVQRPQSFPSLAR